MNVTFPQSRVGPWLPFLLALVAASALGVGAGISTVMLIDANWQSEYSRLNAPSTGHFATGDTPSLVLYLVDSQEQEDFVLAGEQEAANERAGANAIDPHYSVLVIKATTPEDELSVAEIVQAWSTQPEGLQIVDLRGK